MFVISGEHSTHPTIRMVYFKIWLAIQFFVIQRMNKKYNLCSYNDYFIILVFFSYSLSLNKRQRKPKRQLQMDSPETLATLGSTRHKHKQNKTNIPTRSRRWTQALTKCKQFLFPTYIYVLLNLIFENVYKSTKYLLPFKNFNINIWRTNTCWNSTEVSVKLYPFM